MPARYGYGQTKVRNSPAPSKEWMDIWTRAMDRAMYNRKKKKKVLSIAEKQKRRGSKNDLEHWLRHSSLSSTQQRSPNKSVSLTNKMLKQSTKSLGISAAELNRLRKK